MMGEDAPTEFITLAKTNCSESSAFAGDGKASDAAEQVEMCRASVIGHSVIGFAFSAFSTSGQ